MWLWVVGVVAVVGAVTVIAVGSGDALGDVYEDRPDHTVPVGRPLAADDLRDVTFSTAVRGYRMDEVDAFLERIRADLLAREAHERLTSDHPLDAEPAPDDWSADPETAPDDAPDTEPPTSAQ